MNWIMNFRIKLKAESLNRLSFFFKEVIAIYPYHAIIKQRIRNGELIDIQDCENYNKVGRCKLLIFSSPPFKRPIRPERFEEYRDILLNFYERRGIMDSS